ncbi:energy-coupling factor ABC transporter substrate-binding protein [Pseudoduganella sp. HUAS MS19]
MKASTALLWGTIVLLTVLPLWLAAVPPAEPGAAAQEAFAGADARAQQAISTIAPAYQPWFAPPFEPPSGEIASLLFALQAAAGAGVIGFWLGMSVARERERRRAHPASGRDTDAN